MKRKTQAELIQNKKYAYIKDLNPNKRYTVRYLVDENHIPDWYMTKVINALSDKVKPNKKKYEVEAYWQDIIDYITK